MAQHRGLNALMTISTGGGLPTLDAGEFGYDVNSNSLYIGNPYYGNTKIYKLEFECPIVGTYECPLYVPPEEDLMEMKMINELVIKQDVLLPGVSLLDLSDKESWDKIEMELGTLTSVNNLDVTLPDNLNSYYPKIIHGETDTETLLTIANHNINTIYNQVKLPIGKFIIKIDCMSLKNNLLNINITEYKPHKSINVKYDVSRSNIIKNYTKSVILGKRYEFSLNQATSASVEGVHPSSYKIDIWTQRIILFESFDLQDGYDDIVIKVN